MTKKKSKKSQEDQFEPRKSKSSIQHIPQPKNRGPPRGEKQKKQLQRVPVYNKLGIEDRRAQQERYRQSFLAKKGDEQKRGFRALRYDFDADSQMGDIDSDSIQRRNDNETIKKIKELLDEEEMNQNRQRCDITARNQQAKVQKLSESLYQRHNEYKDLIERMKPTAEEYQKGEISLESSQDNQQIISKEDSIKQVETSQTKFILEKINQLQPICY